MALEIFIEFYYFPLGKFKKHIYKFKFPGLFYYTVFVFLIDIQGKLNSKAESVSNYAMHQ